MFGSRRELRQARRKGKRDGRAGVPALAEGSLPFDLRGILARAQEQVQRLNGAWRQDDRALETELSDLDQRAIAANARLADAEMQRDAALAEHERREADEDERLNRLQGQLEELPTDLPADEIPEPEVHAPVALVAPIAGASAPRSAPVAAEPRPDPASDTWSSSVELARDASWRGFGPLVYWPLITLIVIGEIPLNAFAFRLFHESDLLTYAMTVTVAVGLVAIAHFLGLLASRELRTSMERALIAVFVVVPVAAITVISFVRYGYLTDVGGDSGVGPVLGTLAFGTINLLVFGAAAGLSFLHHDPRTLVNRRAAVRAAERERARLERRRAHEQRTRMRRERRLEDDVRKRAEEQQRRQLEIEQDRRRRELDLLAQRRQVNLEARKNEVLARREQIAEAMRPIRDAARERAEAVIQLNDLVDEARAGLGEVEQRIQAVSIERRARWEQAEAAIREVKATRERLVSEYCSANVRAREDHGTPACFDQIPELEVPAAFELATSEVS